MGKTESGEGASKTITYEYALWGPDAKINTIGFYRPNHIPAPDVETPGAYNHGEFKYPSNG